MNLQLRVFVCLAIALASLSGCSHESELAGNNGSALSDGDSSTQAADASTHDSSVTATDTEPKKDGPTTKASMANMSKMMKKFPASKDMKFKDEIETNVELPKDISELTFIDKDGGSLSLKDYFGKQYVILVFTEGFNGMICPFCKTQTSRLIANYDEFVKRDCEVIVVYPGPEDHLDEFLEAAKVTEKHQVDKVPFPIVLDKDFTATNYFDIHSMHAHPATYLIDKQGAVQFAYVGKDMTADRPSVKAILGKIDAIEK